MDKLLARLEEHYAGMNGETTLETHWSMLAGLFNSGVQAAYQSRYGREYCYVTRWGSGENSLYTAHFPKSNVLVANDEIVDK